MLWHDLGLFVIVYFVLWLLQLVALPVILFLSTRLTYLRDAAWGFGRMMVLLVLSLVVWHLAHWQLPLNTAYGVWGLFLILLFSSFYLAWRFFLRRKNFWRNFWTKFGKTILLEEAIFLLALIFLFVVRSFQPEILGLEKFMDAGFIQAYLKSPTLPVGDIWYATDSINYYSFGQFYNAILVHLWQMDLAYGYNFLLMTVFALLCVESFAVAFNLSANLGKQRWSVSVGAGLLAVFLVALGANGHTMWYFFSQGNFNAYWYPDATRFIERTIHEFPAYSFVVCDLHAHVLSLPISLLLLQMVFIWLQEITLLKKLPKFTKILRSSVFYLALVMGVLLGVLVMTNTWDILIYGLLLTVVSLFLLVRNKKLFPILLLSAGAVFLSCLALSALWLLNFTPISSGLLLTTEHSPFWQLAVMWGPHLFLALVLLWLGKEIWFAGRNFSALTIFLLALLLVVAVLIIFPELFYFVDIYTTYPRANTMFKLVFQAFMLLGILLSVLLSTVLLSNHKNDRLFAWKLLPVKNKTALRAKLYLRRSIFIYLPIGVFLFFSTLAYPYLAYRSYYGGFRNYQGLNGSSWLERKSPGDLAIINYLKENEPKQVNIVEAVGESYSEFARISAFSGMPTILGWRVHEWLWRAGWNGPGQRTSEVEKIYLQPTHSEIAYYLERYQIKYIVVGGKEREAYPKLNLEGLLSLGETVLTVGEHYLIRID